MSSALFVSPATRFVAALRNATYAPSDDMAEGELRPLKKLPCTPAELTLTRSVVPATRSRTKMSAFAFVSLGTRLLARLVKATKRPSDEMAGRRSTLPFP
jgi:hypothetical protein